MQVTKEGDIGYKVKDKAKDKELEGCSKRSGEFSFADDGSGHRRNRVHVTGTIVQVYPLTLVLHILFFMRLA